MGRREEETAKPGRLGTSQGTVALSQAGGMVARIRC